MNRNLYGGRVLLALAPFLTNSPEVQATLANRVFVSQRLGNDTNSCDNILTPCQTFAGAVLQLNPGGEAIVLDSGGYGPVTITQAVTIEAPTGVLAFIHPPSGDAITINAGVSDKVIIRGLALNAGTGSGIHVNTVGMLHVENCVINGFTLAGIDFFASGVLLVKDTVIRNCVNIGVNLGTNSGSAVAYLDRVRLDGNGYANLNVDRNGKATIRDSVASNGPNIGLLANDTSTGFPVELDVENCLTTNNLTGILSSGVQTVLRVSNTTVTQNATGLNATGSGKLLSRLNNTVEGNTSNGAFTASYSAK